MWWVNQVSERTWTLDSQKAEKQRSGWTFFSPHSGLSCSPGSPGGRFFLVLVWSRSWSWFWSWFWSWSCSPGSTGTVNLSVPWSLKHETLVSCPRVTFIALQWKFCDQSQNPHSITFCTIAVNSNVLSTGWLKMTSNHWFENFWGQEFISSRVTFYKMIWWYSAHGIL